MSDTKQAILTVALTLFSQKGYTAVSIRDICKQVGIKESSVYYHFKNKQAIFDALEERFRNTCDYFTSCFTGKVEAGDEVSMDRSLFEKVCKIYVESFLLDDFNISFIRALNIERFSNENARKLYDQWMFEYPLQFQSGILSYLMQLNFLPVADSDYMAIQYYAPIYFYYEQYILSGEVTEESKLMFRQHVYKHVAEFLKD